MKKKSCIVSRSLQHSKLPKSVGERGIQIYEIFVFALLLLSQCAREYSRPGFAFNEQAGLASRIFFSRPEPDASAREKNRARNEILRLIEQAESSLDVWCYSFDDELLARALAAAVKRGLRVEIAGSPEFDYEILKKYGLRIRIRSKSGLQHVKLILIDGQRLYSGTGNFTRSGFFHNHNAFFILEMGKEKGKHLKEALNGRSDVPLRNMIPGVNVFVAPQDGRIMQNMIVSSILSARYHIRYLIFSHTDPIITSALYFAASRGVVVEGIYDDFADDNLPSRGT